MARNGPAGVSSHPAVEAFEGLGGALAYLHGRWIVYFGVALDEEAEGRAGSLADSAVRAWERTTSRHQDLARILSHHRTHPAVRAAEESHLGMLAGLSGSPATGFPSFLL